MTIVLRRDENGREVLWKCSSCGQPFDLGWGSECNKCLTEERRHRELVAATKKEIHAPTGGGRMKYEMGQKVWCVSMENVTEYVTCPDCLGQKQLRVILGDGTEVAVDCAACKRGDYRSRGNLEFHRYAPLVKESLITGIALKHGKEVYCGEGFWNDEGERVFGTKEEAEAAGVLLAEKFTQEEIKRAHAKEKDGKTWAWHVSYHRRAAERARKELDYHTGKLTLAKLNAKEVSA